MAGYRGRGKGSVFYDKARGRWIASVSLEPDPLTGRRPRRKMSAATEAEAGEVLTGMLAEMEQTGSVSKKNYTTGMAIADLVAHPPEDVEDGQHDASQRWARAAVSPRRSGTSC